MIFSCGDQDRPLEEVVNVEYVSANPPPLIDDEIRAALLQIDQAITTQDQAATLHDLSMTTQDN